MVKYGFLGLPNALVKKEGNNLYCCGKDEGWYCIGKDYDSFIEYTLDEICLYIAEFDYEDRVMYNKLVKEAVYEELLKDV